MRRKYGFLALSLILLLAACTGTAGDAGPAGPAGPAGADGAPGPAGPAGADASAMAAADLTCTECHNDSSIITGKKAAWEESLHSTGEAFVRGESSGCAGCHSGGGFSAMIAAGLNPSEVTEGDPNPTHQDCRTCHAIHTTFTGADWALETTAAVDLYAFEGVTFDGGSGNLCAVCHQPRRQMDAAVDGMVEVTSTHWGPHHGPQSAMLLGVGAAPGVEGRAASHATMVADTCVTCHLGETDDHTYEVTPAACVECHGEIEDFDLGGTQTDVQAMLDELEAALKGKGLLDADGGIVVGSYPEAEAGALWNWIYVAHEDKSLGVHNPSYTKDILQAGLDALSG